MNESCWNSYYGLLQCATDKPRTKMMDGEACFLPAFDTMMCALHQRTTQVLLLWIGLVLVTLCPWSSSSAFQLPLSQLSSAAVAGTTRRSATTTTTPRCSMMIRQRDRHSFWARAAEPERQFKAESSTTTPTLEEQGVVELATTTTTAATTNNNNKAPSSAATFLSQGGIDPANLKVDLSNPQQTRVILYIILSLIPVLFLIPLMLGSRELLPLILAGDETLPPVDL